VIDRTYAIERKVKDIAFYLISAGATPSEEYMELMLKGFPNYISCFRAGGNKECGHIFGTGTNNPGDITGMPAMEQAYEMGKAV